MKTVEFIQTTKGYIAKVNDIIVWFIRDEPRLKPNEKWFVYKSEDGGKGFKLIPAECIRDENGNVITATHWGWKTLQEAKSFVYEQEMKGAI